ncbi:hypothetical protein MMS45_29245 [Escherichia coli]|nr:hypothetical protein [Escherichia coli]
MNINAGHEITSKARIIHQIQLIRGITVTLSSLSCFGGSDMSCPKCGSGNIAKEKTMRGWSDDYVCCDCGYNDSKDAFGERGKNDFVKINKEREGNEKS